MKIAKTHPPIPHYGDIDGAYGWAIKFGESRLGESIVLGKTPTSRLLFGSKADTEAAIRALADAGITTIDAVLKRDRREVVQICCCALAW